MSQSCPDRIDGLDAAIGMKPRVLAVSLVLSMVLTAGCANAPTAMPVGTEVTLMQPLPGVFTAGQPAAKDWAAIRATGIHTVINLRTPGELKGRDEAAEVRAAGMHYLEIPVAGADGINLANAGALHAALAPAHGGGVLVHCASGNRVGALLALEQQAFDGLAPKRALELGQAAGLASLEPVARERLGMPSNAAGDASRCDAAALNC